MSLFRSEEHVMRWLHANDKQRGEVLPLEQVWRLAQAWYRDPRDPAWRARTADESQEVLSSVGLTSDFWKFG